MPLSRWAQRSTRVVALGAAVLGLGPRTSSPAPAPLTTAPAALDGTDDVALAFRVADDDTDLINADTIDTINTAADAVGRLTAKGAWPANPERIAADSSPAAPCP